MLRKNKIFKDYFFSHFAMTLRQRSGFFILIAIIIGLEILIQFPLFKTENKTQVFTTEELALIQLNHEKTSEEDAEGKAVDLFKFNPNALDLHGFVRLGFSPKQAKSIIKYRYTLGGNFESIEEFGASYVISDRKLQELKPYINLSIVYNPHNKSSRNSKYKNSVTNLRLKPFDLNKQTKLNFMNMGFSEKQTATILNFKESLPNQRFNSPEQFHQSYGVNDYMFDKLEPYLIIRNAKPKKVVSSDSKIYLNTIDVNRLKALGLSSENASGIIKYREFIGGFKTVDDLESCKYINDTILEILKKGIY